MANIAPAYDATKGTLSSKNFLVPLPRAILATLPNHRNRMALRLTPEDRFLSNPTKMIEGYTRTTGGDPVQGTTVMLFRQSDDVYIGRTTTDANGRYRFLRDASDDTVYYTVGYTLRNNTQIHGTSNRGLVPSLVPVVA